MSLPTVRILGIGMGPQHVTPEVADALRACDYAVAWAKRYDDELVAVRQAICAAHGVELVVLADPERDRSPGLGGAGYRRAVADWHAARAEALAGLVRDRGGVAGLLVWGDPSLYDSTIRVVEATGLPFDVLPGISAPQALAARHRIVLHEVGRPVHVTTARRLREAVEGGQDNVVVMLTSGVDLDGLEDWRIWWGANLGATGERLVAGRVADVTGQIETARAAAKAEAGWVMDLFLLRGPA
ncbi:MAG TPA: precorrin-6A synthase (deacetylating) [Nocardioides sp.]|nr:precorrin-6A synthase (deacetylating) [Nocardioides sp.]